MKLAAYATAAMAIACWGSLALATQLSLQQIPPRVLLFWSFLWASISLGIHSVWRRQALKEIRAATPANLVIGLLGTFGSYFCYFSALERAPAIEANLLNYTWPLQLLVLSLVFLGEPLRWQINVAMGLGMAGAFLLIGQGHWPHLSSEHAIGYMFAFLSGSTWSVYSLMLRVRESKNFSLFVSVASATIASLAFAWREPLLFRLSLPAVLLSLYIGVVTIAVGYVAWGHALRHGDVQIVAALAYLTPLFSTLLLAMAGKNRLSAASSAGMGMIVAASILATQRSKAKRITAAKS